MPAVPGYVPAGNIDLLQKYTSPDGAAPVRSTPEPPHSPRAALHDDQSAEDQSPRRADGEAPGAAGARGDQSGGHEPADLRLCHDPRDRAVAGRDPEHDLLLRVAQPLRISPSDRREGVHS